VIPWWLYLMLDTARLGMPRRDADCGGGRAMLVELSVTEQRYHAVMEVVSGAPAMTALSICADRGWSAASTVSRAVY
jgi:hypothetical protein